MFGKGFGQQIAIYQIPAWYAQNGDYNNVIRYTNALIEMGFATELVYTFRGLARANKGNYDAALSDHSQALDAAGRSKADLAMPLIHRAYCYRQQGNPDAAIQDCNRAIEIVTQRPSMTGGYEQTLVYAYMDRGLAYSAKGDHRQALADCEQAFIHAKMSEPEKQSLVYADRGSVLGTQGNYDSAMADFNRALQLAESRPYAKAWAYWRRGLVRVSQGDRAGAISDFTAAIEVCPQLVDPYRSRGDQYKAMGNSQQANADYQKVIELRSDPPDALDPEKLKRELRAITKRPINKNMAAMALVLALVMLALLVVIVSQLR